MIKANGDCWRTWITLDVYKVKLRDRVVDTKKSRPGNHFSARSLYFLPCLIPNSEEGNGTQRPKHLLGESKWTKKTFTDTISDGKILQFVKMRSEKRKFKEIKAVQFLVKSVDLVKLIEEVLRKIITMLIKKKYEELKKYVYMKYPVGIFALGSPRSDKNKQLAL